MNYKGWEIENFSGTQVGDYLTGKWGQKIKGKGRKVSGVIAKSPPECGSQEKFFGSLKQAKKYIDNY